MQKDRRRVGAGNICKRKGGPRTDAKEQESADAGSTWKRTGEGSHHVIKRPFADRGLYVNLPKATSKEGEI